MPLVWALRAMQAAAVLLPPVLLVVDAPFGKLGRASAWNVHGNGAWMAMELVAPCALLANAYARGALAWPTQALVALFVLHYVNRAVYQPWRNPPRSPLHLSVVLSAMAFNLVNGTLLGAWLAHGGTTHHGSVWTGVGVALFALGLWGNMHHDARLRRLRIGAPAPGEPVVQGRAATYRIPRGALFEWVSYPNYLCECTSRHSHQGSSGPAMRSHAYRACPIRARPGTTTHLSSLSCSKWPSCCPAPCAATAGTTRSLARRIRRSAARPSPILCKSPNVVALADLPPWYVRRAHAVGAALRWQPPA